MLTNVHGNKFMADGPDMTFSFVIRFSQYYILIGTEARHGGGGTWKACETSNPQARALGHRACPSRDHGFHQGRTESHMSSLPEKAGGLEVFLAAHAQYTC